MYLAASKAWWPGVLCRLRALSCFNEDLAHEGRLRNQRPIGNRIPSVTQHLVRYRLIARRAALSALTRMDEKWPERPNYIAKTASPGSPRKHIDKSGTVLGSYVGMIPGFPGGGRTGASWCVHGKHRTHARKHRRRTGTSWRRTGTSRRRAGKHRRRTACLPRCGAAPGNPGIIPARAEHWDAQETH